MEELIQVVDDNDEPLRGASINDACKHGLRHRTVYALVRDMNGRLLVQLRGNGQQFYPNHWGTSAAGYAFENERYDVAVMRKLAEELGLSNLELREVGTFNTDEVVDNQTLKRVNKVFETEVPAEAELRTDPDKVTELRWLSLDELRALAAHPTEQVTPALREVIVRYL